MSKIKVLTLAKAEAGDRQAWDALLGMADEPQPRRLFTTQIGPNQDVSDAYGEHDDRPEYRWPEVTV